MPTIATAPYNAGALAAAIETVRQLELLQLASPERDAAKASAANTANLVGAIKDPPPVVKNAQFYGAKGDGKTDDTAALQRMADACAPGAPFIIDTPGDYLVNFKGVEFTKPSDVRLLKVPGVNLRMIPNDQPRSYVLRFRSTASGSDVDLGAARLIGDRYAHNYRDTGTKERTHEWGYGVFVAGTGTKVYSSNVDLAMDPNALLAILETLALPKVTGFPGDGIGVTGAGHHLWGIDCDGNRRQGLSAFNPGQLEVNHCIFQNTGNGGAKDPAGLIGPFCGMDIEPDVGDALGSRIHHNIFRANQKSGFIGWLRKEVIGRLTGEFTDNWIIGNVNGAWTKDASESRKGTIVFKFLRNTFRNQSALGVRADYGSDLLLQDNTFDRTGDRPDRTVTTLPSPDLGRYGNAVVSAPSNKVV